MPPKIAVASESMVATPLARTAVGSASDQTAPLTPNSSATASRAMVCTSRNEAKVPSSMPNSGNGSTTKSRPKAMTSGRRPTRSPSRPAPRMAARKITWATSEAERVVDLSI